ncbi:MAG: site-2 protease family protein, partial [Deinococcota bacterium]|nr:site-2 protease family protein [Deinococcota bacterium]
MFQNAYRLPFRLLGIPLQLDITFLIVLPLFAWIIGSQLPRFIELFNLPIDPAPLSVGFTPFLLGFLAALGLFVSVVVHELGHSVVARRYGVKVKSITLWLLGGMAQLETMPKAKGAEAVVAVTGPLTS